jgi:hypothetical protein
VDEGYVPEGEIRPLRAPFPGFGSRPLPEKPAKCSVPGTRKNTPNIRPDCRNTGGNAIAGGPPKALTGPFFRNVILPIRALMMQPELALGKVFFRGRIKKMGFGI